jgi:hypothetical protein
MAHSTDRFRKVGYGVVTVPGVVAFWAQAAAGKNSIKTIHA